MEKKEKKPNKLMVWVGEHPKTVFWTRFALWAVFACILPFVFIAWRFELFQVITKMQIGGWGIIAFLIVFAFVFVLLRYIRIALKSKYSFFGQLISGVCKVIVPLVALYVILYNVRNNIDIFLQALGCVILCETAAIVVNPMPKWVYEKQKEANTEQMQDTVDYLLTQFFDKKKKSDNGGN